MDANTIKNYTIEDYRANEILLYFAFRVLNHKPEISLSDIENQIRNDFHFDEWALLEDKTKAPLYSALQGIVRRSLDLQGIVLLSEREREQSDEQWYASCIPRVQYFHEKYSELYSKYAENKNEFGAAEEIEEMKVARFLSNFFKDALRKGILQEKSDAHRSFIALLEMGLFMEVYIKICHHKNMPIIDRRYKEAWTSAEKTEFYSGSLALINASKIEDTFVKDYRFIQANKHHLEQADLMSENSEMFTKLYDACQRTGIDLNSKFEFLIAHNLMLAEVNEAMPFSSLEEIEFEGMILERN